MSNRSFPLHIYVAFVKCMQHYMSSTSISYWHGHSRLIEIGDSPRTKTLYYCQCVLHNIRDQELHGRVIVLDVDSA